MSLWYNVHFINDRLRIARFIDSISSQGPPCIVVFATSLPLLFTNFADGYFDDLPLAPQHPQTYCLPLDVHSWWEVRTRIPNV